MLDYDAEADTYDETRGGLPRARAAADAVRSLVGGGTLVDVACGTGLVSRELARSGLRVLGIDASHGMARMAAGRVPVAVGDSRRLPLPDASVDAVSLIWLLHLVGDAAPIVAECARVLRPGGVLVTTVDKSASYRDDLDPLLAPFRRATDEAGLITELAAEHGLRPAGEAAFTGHGQTRTPAKVIADLKAGRYSFSPGQSLLDSLEALPDQEQPRPEPVYRLLAFS